MADLVNDYAWSHSSASTFRECPRRWWLGKVEAWEGWPNRGRRSRVPTAALAYRLSKMQNYWTTVGKIVHEVAQLAIEGKLSSPEEAKPWALQRLREIQSNAKHGRWKQNPKKFPPLFEYYYLGGVTDQSLIDAIRRALDASIEGLYESTAFDLVTGGYEAKVIELESLDKIEVDGWKAFCVPDLLISLEDGVELKVFVIDWKSGKPKDSDFEQVLAYALYVLVRYGSTWNLKPSQIEIVVEYLKTGETKTIVPDQTDIERVRGRIREDSKEISKRFTTEGINSGNREDFPRTENLRQCKQCDFFELCRGNDQFVRTHGAVSARNIPEFCRSKGL